MSFTPAEVAFLAAGTSRHPDLTFSPRTQLADVSFLREAYGEHARAVAELLTARRSGKFPGGEDTDWLADSDSAQQATPPEVAAWRAAYLRSLGVESVLDVTCSIGTEGHALRAAGLGYVGSDLDFSRLLMARHNVPGAQFLLADALRPAVDLHRAAIIADPARRAGGRRITDPARLLPPLPGLLEAYAGRALAVKCAPGLDFSAWEGLVEVTSVDGAVKEACLYSPELSGGGIGKRRAVMLCDGDADVVEDAGQTPEELPAAGEPGRFIIDPDGAVVRAGLVKHYAAREGLWQLDEHIAYLTGDRLPAGTSGFEVREAVPLKKLKSALAGHDCGVLEILVRGVDVDPDQLRKKLKLRGSQSLAVVIVRVGDTPMAYICGARVSSDES